MIDLDKFNIEILCPKCGFYNEIRFKQARLRDVVICRGCKRNIHLDDHMNECRNARTKIRKVMQEFIESFKNIMIKI